jgi:hypothetical protein
VPDPSPFEVEIAITKFKKYKSPGSDQIPAELIQAGGETLWALVRKLINFICNKETLADKWNLLLYQCTRRAIKLTVVIIVGYHYYQLHTKCYPLSFYKSIYR